ncbi:MAG TPA: peptidase M61, partial [Burkholderiaceae bacterium]
MARQPPALDPGAPTIGYRVEIANLHAHLYRITLTVAQPAALQTVSLPAWIPGSYLVREFARHLQNLQARQGTRTIPCEQLDKHSWALHCNPAKPLVLRYEVYAFDASVRTAWLDAMRGFF